MADPKVFPPHRAALPKGSEPQPQPSQHFPSVTNNPPKSEGMPRRGPGRPTGSPNKPKGPKTANLAHAVQVATGLSPKELRAAAEIIEAIQPLSRRKQDAILHMMRELLS